MRTGTAQSTVTLQNTARAMGSGSLEVFATPALVALMESAACNALEGTLEEGVTTVGVEICVEHLAATPVGMAVRAEAALISQEGRAYAFSIEAFDEAGLIGKAEHRRVAVKAERFQQKAEAKKNN